MTREEAESRLLKMRKYRSFIIESDGPRELKADMAYVKARLGEVGHDEKLADIVFDK